MINRNLDVANIANWKSDIDSKVSTLQTKTVYMSSSGNNTNITSPLTLTNQPGFWAKLGTSQTYTFNGATVLAFNHVVYNIGNHYNSSNGRFTVPATGRYIIAASAMQNAIANGWMAIEFYRNGAVDYNLPATSNTTTGWPEHGVTLCSAVRLTAGDYIQLAVYKSYTGTLGNGGGASDWGEARNFFSIQRVA